MKKTGLCNRGQVGPGSLEDVFPMAMAILVIFVFIAFVFSTLGDLVAARNAESAYDAAFGISHVLMSKSVFVYSGKEGLLDSAKLDEYAYFYDELAGMYGVTGYDCSIRVTDLEETGRGWYYAPSETSSNPVSVGFPVAIRYSGDFVHSGLLEVKVWRHAK